jgi:hypothetical protein
LDLVYLLSALHARHLLLGRVHIRGFHSVKRLYAPIIDVLRRARIVAAAHYLRCAFN